MTTQSATVYYVNGVPHVVKSQQKRIDKSIDEFNKKARMNKYSNLVQS